ncbi:MAG: hemolysin III family protein [Bacteroidota bacterium]
MNTKKRQSNIEESFNAISHGITGLAAIAGMIVLIVITTRSGQSMGLFCALFYGISLVVMYAMSTIYHAVRHSTLKKFFNMMDHISIFLLIAGTYTPVSIMIIGGSNGWLLFGLQWGIALFGSILKIFFTGRYEILSLILYGVMGWMIIFQIDQLIESLQPGGLWLLVAGGVTYTLGIVFYVIDTRLKLAHFIWHLFVIAGSLLHYLMMVLYVF